MIGWDPIFEYEGQTYAEMDKAEKVSLSRGGMTLSWPYISTGIDDLTEQDISPFQSPAKAPCLAEGERDMITERLRKSQFQIDFRHSIHIDV